MRKLIHIRVIGAPSDKALQNYRQAYKEGRLRPNAMHTVEIFELPETFNITALLAGAYANFDNMTVAGHMCNSILTDPNDILVASHKDLRFEINPQSINSVLVKQGK